MAHLETSSAVATDARAVVVQARARIAPLDGLRAVAVVGVLYAHIWSFVLGCPRLAVAGIDVNRALSLFGTGVDLFFVISGFCMFLMYGSKQQGLDWRTFGTFIGNRFRRIAPAFYVSMFVSACFVATRRGSFPYREVLAYATFTFTLFPSVQVLAASFWSLATEWHFYLLLPPLLHAAKRMGFWRALAFALSLSIACRFVVAFSPAAHSAVVDQWITSRFVEFGWGLAAARLYLDGVRPPRWLRGAGGFVLGWAVAMCGRVMMTDGATRLATIGPVFEALSVVVLSFGFMLVVWNVVTEPSVFASALATAPMRWIGKLSYSLYLWHWDFGLAAAAMLARKFGAFGWSPLVYTAVVLVALLPLAAASYRLLEAPYFVKRRVAR